MFKMCCGECGECWWVGNPRACKCPDEEPKREFVGLTDEDIKNLDWMDIWMDGMGREDRVALIKDVEAKLKEKNIW